MTTQTTTHDDARARVAQARIGSLVDPSHDYLQELRVRLCEWLSEVECQILKDTGTLGKTTEREARLFRERASDE